MKYIVSLHGFPLQQYQVGRMADVVESKSADGVSLGFVGLWAIGDVLNLAGSLWAQLVPTTIVVAVYYILSDAVIICEALYYRAIAASKNEIAHEEYAPLLHAASDESSNSPKTSILKEILYNTLACLAVTALGVFGWYVSNLVLNDRHTSPHSPDSHTTLSIGPQILGYSAAMLYLCARIPQILKNYRKQRTDGLALLFFVFSVFGNLTYAASILAFSSDRDYLVTNISWLLGSLGTLVFDFVILLQFLAYRHLDEEIEAEPSLINT